jgi:hypothetical protein
VIDTSDEYRAAVYKWLAYVFFQYDDTEHDTHLNRIDDVLATFGAEPAVIATARSMAFAPEPNPPISDHANYIAIGQELPDERDYFVDRPDSSTFLPLAPPSPYQWADYRAALFSWPRRCSYCGRPATHADHIIPRSRGGSDHFDNLTPSCGDCNVSKGARTPEEWMAQRAKSGKRPWPPAGAIHTRDAYPIPRVCAEGGPRCLICSAT